MKQLILYVFLTAVLLTACGRTKSQMEYISDTLGMDFSAGQVLTESDSYSGWLGDGLNRVEIQMDADFENLLSERSDWKVFPLMENLQRVLYGKREGTYSMRPLLEDVPIIEDGYYYFFDRHNQSTDPTSAAEIFSRNSFNFTLALFDCETDILYYFEFDT